VNSGIDANGASALWAAYSSTTYAAVINGQTLNIRVDHRTPALDAELSRRRVATWAFLTAWNPRSQRLLPAENDTLQLTLREGLVHVGFDVAEGRGIPESDDWTPEASLLVFGISAPDAMAIGARFGQLAIVVGQQDRVARLIACEESMWC
jgi:hypothetical protein